MNVSLFIAGRQDRVTVELPTGATVAQLKSKVSSLWTGIFKSLTSWAVTTLNDDSVLEDGMNLSFAPTEEKRNSSGQVEYSTKKIAGANNEITLTPVKVVKQSVFLETTLPSVLTVADVLKQANISSACVFINWQEVGRATQLGNEPVTLEVRDCEEINIFWEDEDEEEDEDEDETDW